MSKITIFLLAIIIFTFSCAPIQNKYFHPDCINPERWPASMAFVKLKNEGITNNDRLDFSQTQITRLASEQIGNDIYRQVHHIRFLEKSGKIIEVITVNDASHEECSMSGVDVYLVKGLLGM